MKSFLRLLENMYDLAYRIHMYQDVHKIEMCFETNCDKYDEYGVKNVQGQPWE